jgi:hypothetical protein
MRAEFGGEIDIFRLVETSDEIARLQHGAKHRRGIPWVGAQIAVAQIVRGKERRATRKVEYEIASRSRAIAWDFEDKGIS